MDGFFQMFGSAFLVLVITTWLNLEATVKMVMPPLRSRRYLRVLLLSVPYLVFIICTVTSLGVSLVVPIKPKMSELVACVNDTFQSARVRRSIGFIMAIFCVMEVIIEARVIRIMVRNTSRRAALPVNPTRSTLLWADNSIILRVLLLTILEFGILFVGILDASRAFPDTPGSTNVFHIFQSLYSFLTFIIFGSSRNVLSVWGLGGLANLSRGQVSTTSTTDSNSTGGTEQSGPFPRAIQMNFLSDSTRKGQLSKSSSTNVEIEFLPYVPPHKEGPLPPQHHRISIDVEAATAAP